MPYACSRKPLVLAIMAALSSPGLVVAGNIVQTPAGGAVIVTDGDRTTQRFRVNATGEVYVPGLPSTDEVGTDLTCFRGGSGVTADGQLVKCAPGVGTGPQGPQGAAGAQGPQGAEGVRGPQGDTGAAGAQGLDGAQGPMGPQGALGVQGVSGAQGEQGAQGEPGIAGKTILSGEAPPASTDGVDGDYWLDTDTQTLYGPKVEGAWPAGVSLVGPQGAAGAQGPQGAEGVQGPQGDTGAAGAQGLDGAQGAMGPQGALGVQGPQGAQGPQGNDGSCSDCDSLLQRIEDLESTLILICDRDVDTYFNATCGGLDCNDENSDIVLINLFHSLSGDSLHLKYRVHCIKRGPSHV